MLIAQSSYSANSAVGTQNRKLDNYIRHSKSFITLSRVSELN